MKSTLSSSRSPIALPRPAKSPAVIFTVTMSPAVNVDRSESKVLRFRQAQRAITRNVDDIHTRCGPSWPMIDGRTEMQSMCHPYPRSSRCPPTDVTPESASAFASDGIERDGAPTPRSSDVNALRRERRMPSTSRASSSPTVSVTVTVSAATRLTVPRSSQAEPCVSVSSPLPVISMKSDVVDRQERRSSREIEQSQQRRSSSA